MTAIQNVIKGKYGFHSCDFDTYLKLKKLNKFYWKALRAYASHSRWSRKDPKNRILRKWFRNEKGQKTHFEVVGPAPEPKVYPIFGTKNYVPKGEHCLNDLGIVQDYQKARTPWATPEEVKPLNLTVEQIDKLLAELEAFENA